ncbi:MAG: CopG family transcriptional regulator [Acidobacteriota bacterium]
MSDDGKYPTHDEVRPMSLKVTGALDDQVAEAAARRNVSKSELVREAIAEYIVRDPDDPPASSFLAQAQDLAGCLDASPTLSTDSFDGYGE